MVKAKPFVKWVGGKSQLIGQLELLLPSDFDRWQNVTYIEPFVGGGAMLFFMLQNFNNINKAIINDVNSDLTTCYKTIRDNPKELIRSLKEIQQEYYAIKQEEDRKTFYLTQRTLYNTKRLDDVLNTTLFIFLNRTCFNGLYRVNKSGAFNVPFGRYTSPMICDEQTIMADSELLQRVEILTGDFEHTLNKASNTSFFYLDPPYRPLSNTSSFTDYTKESFNDEAQIRLKNFCDKLMENQIYFMLSNSDGLNNGGEDRFFYDLYEHYRIDRVFASRNINAIASKRGILSEIVVSNFDKVLV